MSASTTDKVSTTRRTGKHGQTDGKLPTVTASTPEHSTGASQRRRRNQQSFKKNGNQYHYASEPSSDLNTRDKRTTHSATAIEVQSDDSKPRRRQKSKGKPATSLEAGSQNNKHGDIRSNTAPRMTPVKPAYAGPTFHASPAASALPMPKFLSKSVPDPNVEQSLQSLAEKEEVAELQDTPAKGHQPTIFSNQNVQSPLEIFFRADREERAKRSVSSPEHHSPASVVSPLSDRSRVNTNRPSSITDPIHKRPGSSVMADREMFMMELNEGSPEHTSTSLPDPSLSESRTVGESRSLNEHSYSPSATSRVTDDDYFRPIPPLQRNTNIAFGQSITPEQLFATASSKFSSNGHVDALPTTPRTPNGEQLHYGNRNLSPLFKATKTETPKQASGLRREVTDSLLTASVNDSSMKNAKMVSKGAHNAADISRSYLQNHIDTMPTSVNQFHLNKTSGTGNGRPKTVDGSVHVNPVPSFDNEKSSLQDSRIDGALVDRFGPTTGGGFKSSNAGNISSKPISVHSMEEDLRRLLKLDKSP